MSYSICPLLPFWTFIIAINPGGLLESKTYLNLLECLESAILDFSLTVSSKLVVHRCYYSPLDSWMWSVRHCYIRMNFVDILCTRWVVSINEFRGRHFPFALLVASRSFTNSSSGISNLTNGVYSRWNSVSFLSRLCNISIIVNIT